MRLIRFLKSQKQVKKLIAGSGVYICDECIDLCNEIIEEELAEPGEVKWEDRCSASVSETREAIA